MNRKLISRAKKLIDQGDYEKAQPILLTVIKEEPRNEQVYLLLLMCNEPIEQKIIYLQKTLEINPKNLSAQASLKELVDKQKADSNAKAEKSTTKRKLNAVRSSLPDLVFRTRKDNFFNGYREGIEPISRMETGFYGNNLIVGGIRLSLYDGPPCIRIDNPQVDTECDQCEFYSPQNCLLRFDTFLLEDIHRLMGSRIDRSETYARRRRLIVRTLYRELKAHGRPLHFTVIAKIMMGRHPKFQLRARNVYRYMSWHPELFERLDDGVYRAK